MKILIADDDPDALQVLALTVEMWGHEVIRVTDGNQAWAVLRTPDAPTLAILDWMMPGLNGPEICQRLRERGSPYVYVILLTARGHKNDVITGLALGADDFLVKPFDGDELKVRLRTGQRIIELQEALLETQKELRFDATHDHLTGVGNRAMIVERLLRELERGARAGDPTSVILADLDHFKRVNDTHGHAAGDRVLRAAAEKMESSIRPYDAIGRYGGEEFLVVLHACEEATASALAERIRERVAAEPVAIPGASAGVSVSLGVAACPRGKRISPDALVAAADAALYRAKAAGRNRVEVATEEEVDAASRPDGRVGPASATTQDRRVHRASESCPNSRRARPEPRH